MSTFTTSMFASIKDALQKDVKSSSAIADIMRLEKGNSYLVRLIPNIKDPAKTFFHYYVHGWESFATGQYISAVSPQTFGERDPIAEYRYKANRTGNAAEKAKAKAITRLEKWLVNVYVIDDPVNPENNGKIKVLRYGKQLYNIIMEAIEGEDADQLGPRIFDLSPEGCSLRVKIEDQGGFPTYVTSKFLMPGAVDGLSEDKYQDVQEGVIALDEVFTIKSYNELQETLNEHYHCKDTETVPDPDLEEDVPGFNPGEEFNKTENKSPSTTAATTAAVSDDVTLDDDKIKQLLAGLDE